MKKTRCGLTGNALKIIAMLSMLIDHIGFYLFPHVMLLRAVGRISFPIFAYMIAEGCTHTRNRTRYFSVIFLVGLLCQATVTIATGIFYMNILIVFSLALAAIFAAEVLLKQRAPLPCSVAALTLVAVAVITFVLPRILRGFILDYNEFGVLLPVLLYFTHGRWQKIIGTALVLAVFSLLSPAIQWCSLAAVPLLALYNGERGRAKIKYLFYVFYPTHQAILWFVAEFCIS